MPCEGGRLLLGLAGLLAVGGALALAVAFALYRVATRRWQAATEAESRTWALALRLEAATERFNAARVGSSPSSSAPASPPRPPSPQPPQ